MGKSDEGGFLDSLNLKELFDDYGALIVSGTVGVVTLVGVALWYCCSDDNVANGDLNQDDEGDSEGDKEQDSGEDAPAQEDTKSKAEADTKAENDSSKNDATD